MVVPSSAELTKASPVKGLLKTLNLNAQKYVGTDADMGLANTLVISMRMNAMTAIRFRVMVAARLAELNQGINVQVEVYRDLMLVPKCAEMADASKTHLDTVTMATTSMGMAARVTVQQNQECIAKEVVQGAQIYALKSVVMEEMLASTHAMMATFGMEMAVQANANQRKAINAWVAV